MTFVSTSAKAGGSSGAIVQIYSSILGANGQFDFTPVPQTYNDLIISIIGRSPVAASNVDDACLRFNGDTTAANYEVQNLGANNTTPSAARPVNSGFVFASTITGSTATANYFSAVEVFIHGYSNTSRQKTLVGTFSVFVPAAANPQMYSWVGQWHSTAAITRVQGLTLSDASNNFLAGSEMRVYGRL